ncbi:DUF4105 domain-containing protein [Prolixibacteraceae bacterium Z1-6]|uniref:DUF4105 domain-containing protein n=1 Tax=Draconibacterium aestuarii TaxID=2998507 RepID=A0A9X3F664_9BACT|nr:DUF4105 domain-containing protein [Prolixibacteraceae bacterium Z1-6]
MVKQRIEVYKRGLIIFAMLIGAVVLSPLKSRAFQLSGQAEISVVTCSPGNEAYSVYGHSAIRVHDAAYNYDIVFNYGIFDFSAPNFIYRFAAGETDYLLGAYRFDAFVEGYKKEKRSVFEQTLDLTPSEKQKIFDFLLWNAKPENRVYRYNFFFDNCATRIRDVLADNIEGGLEFNLEDQSHKTLRRLTKDYHGKLLWLNFGIDFLVSSESDREATVLEEMFLPDYVMKHFANAKKNGEGIPVVKKLTTIYKAPNNDFKSSKITSPFVVFLLLTLFVVYFSVKEFRQGKIKNGMDYFVFGFNGLMGIVMGWFVLFSEHPAMSPNYNLLWGVPLNLVFAFAWSIKKWRPVLNYYHVFISVWLIAFICCASFVPQYFHPVFYLFVIMVLSRSLAHSIIIFKRFKFGQQSVA